MVVLAVDTAYVFQRGVPDLITSEYKQFYQTKYLFKAAADFVDLNRVPETLLLISDTISQVS